MSDKNKTNKWSNKRKVLVLGGIPLGMIATTAAAAAIFGALAGVQGGGSTAEFNADWVAVTQVDSSAMTFAPANDQKVTNGQLILPTKLAFFPGDAVSVEGAIVSESGKAGYVSGLDFAGLPAGYTAQVVSGCGVKVTDSAATAPYIKFKITAPAELVDGETWTLADAGVLVTPLKSAATAVPAGVTCEVFTSTGE